MSLPLPLGRASHLNLRGEANLSLLFDQGFAGYHHTWDHPMEDGAKPRFFTDFCTAAHSPNAEGNHGGENHGGQQRHRHYAKFHQRRAAALRTLGVESFTYYNHTPLILGLGLPHPAENGFLFDHLTGSPYLPGSSLKGLARAAARVAAQGEMQVEPPTKTEQNPAEFWKAHHERIFGPDTLATTKAKGRLIFYDAFPCRLPKLRVEILTPHHTCHFGDDPKPPADWQDPIPVAFLAISPGEQFTISLRSLEKEEAQRQQDLAQLEALLTQALDLLAVGAKTSSGYGFLSPEKPESVTESSRPASGEDDPTPSPSPPISTTPMTNVTIRRRGSRLEAFRGRKRVADGNFTLLGETELKKLGKGAVRATIQVISVGKHKRIDAIEIQE